MNESSRRKPLPAVTVVLNNVQALLDFLAERRRQGAVVVRIADVESLIARGRVS